MRAHLQIDEIRSIVSRRDAGESYYQIALDLERDASGIRAAVIGWKNGTSRAAKRAKHMGEYDTPPLQYKGD